MQIIDAARQQRVEQSSGCPCCGYRPSAKTVKVIADGKFLVIGDVSIRLSPQEGAVAAVLLRRLGQETSNDSLLAVLYGSRLDSDMPEGPEELVKVIVSRVRARLRGHINIKSTYDRSYIATFATSADDGST